MKIQARDISNNKKIRFSWDIFFTLLTPLLPRGEEHITEKLVKRLQLKSSNSQNVILNTFGNSKGKSATLKYYSCCVKNPKMGCNLYLTGFAVPVICVSLTTL